jgi:TIR domain/NB-ARC domain
MGGIFINYRSEDSQTAATLIDRELRARFGEDLVFLDSRSIQAGSDFVEELLRRVRACSVLLVVIGPRWLTLTNAAGKRQIDDPQDWVRREIAEAFTHELRVVPVLTDGATLPAETDLPHDIAGLSRRQYVPLRHRYADVDLALLAEQIIEVDPELAEAAAADQEPEVHNKIDGTVIGPAVQAHTIEGGVHVQTGNATATGGSNNIVNTGYLAYLAAAQAPRPPAAWPHQVGVIPPRAQCFQDRAQAGRLRSAVLSQVVLAGMGGVGKTQLAADYAHAAWAAGELDVLVWITASTRDAVVSRYAQAGVELCQADPGDSERAMQSFLGWLEPKPDPKPCRWLVVLDDVADQGDLHGLWPPGSPYGRTLVTTRRRDAALGGDSRCLVEVGLFTPEQAAKYLTEALAAHGRSEPPNEITALAADMGHLPLALAQAAAYLVDAGLSAANYRQKLLARATKLSRMLPEPGSLPDDHPATVAAAWAVSLERADQMAPARLARPMLQLAAMLDPNGIPQIVLTSPHALTHLAKASKQEAVRETEAVGALRVLHRLSLVDHILTTAHQAVRVHQLIQWAVRDDLPPDRHGRTARTAADALLAAWPEVERDSALAAALRVNTDMLVRNAEEALWTDGVHPVLFRFGRSLGGSGQVTAAAAYFQDLADTATRRLGRSHRDTLASRHSRARWQGAAGDAAGAADEFTTLLADLQDCYNPDHPAILAARGSLANWRGVAGDAAVAADEFTALLADLRHYYHPDHPDTLATRHGHAWWQGMAGQPAKAAKEFAELLKDMQHCYGPDHPETLATRHAYAWWQGVAGHPAAAAEALQDLLVATRGVLGDDHPATLTTRGNYAHWQGVAGHPAVAVAALQDLLDDTMRILGNNHPASLAVQDMLRDWQAGGRPSTAAGSALERLLADRVPVLGPAHPSASTDHFQAALAMRSDVNDLTRAATALEEWLTERLRDDRPRPGVVLFIAPGPPPYDWPPWQFARRFADRAFYDWWEGEEPRAIVITSHGGIRQYPLEQLPAVFRELTTEGQEHLLIALGPRYDWPRGSPGVSSTERSMTGGKTKNPASS